VSWPPIEDHALIGDTETAALVCRDGTIDWYCVPRFDSPAVFAALLGGDGAGRWALGPTAEVVRTDRRYRDGTLVLETDLHTADGAIRIVDLMPPTAAAESGDVHDLVRVVEGLDGEVEVHTELTMRFDYGSVVPWVVSEDDHLHAVAGPDALDLWTDVELAGEGMSTAGTFTVAAGERVSFVLNWHPSHLPGPAPVDVDEAVDATERWWRDWAEGHSYDGGWDEAVDRSLITLKALTYAPTGGIVAAPTTSLPEWIGGGRNWDYRYVWLRDATLMLTALLHGGYRDEAIAWRDWLLRAVAGSPADAQIMYGLAGERRLTEIELDWLSGYEGSRPVRVGNHASEQTQLDVYGEVIDALHHAREQGIAPDDDAWDLQRVWLEHLEERWSEPDHGMWEIRGDPRHFTHSKVMCWVAYDRSVQAVERYGLDGDVERWRELRDRIHADVLERAWSPERDSFTQSYDDDRLDASLLLLPQLGFLPPADPRIVATVERIDDELTEDGCFVARYETDGSDGLDDPEGAFLLCGFWMVEALAMVGRLDEARERFERLLALRNDVGLLAEEYDPGAGRMLGNFPQAFSHIGLVNAARRLSRAR
jgi:GH15 family glucan-1,4-alpha-glucosidase